MNAVLAGERITLARFEQALPRQDLRADSGAMARLLNGGRWHFHHGPIDLLISARGDRAAIEHAVQAAWHAFAGLLPALSGELAWLRRPLSVTAPFVRPRSTDHALADRVLDAMLGACQPHACQYITPMAAVAGSVADAICGLFDRPGIEQAIVNNGGDIALHLATGASVRLALVVQRGDQTFARTDTLTIHASDSVRGVATSGWRGRSQSLGIADAVTVLGRQAAAADAAATMIANAVDVASTAIRRLPAHEVQAVCDLGELPVTVAVGQLSRDEVDRALEAGQQAGLQLASASLIEAVRIELAGQVRLAGRLRAHLAFGEGN